MRSSPAPSSKRSSLVLLALPRRIDVAGGPWCDLDAFHADAVSALWELTMSWSGAHRPYAAGDLLSAVRTRLRTLQASEHRHRSRQSGSPGRIGHPPGIDRSHGRGAPGRCTRRCDRARPERRRRRRPLRDEGARHVPERGGTARRATCSIIFGARAGTPSTGWWPDVLPNAVEPIRPGTSRADPSGRPVGARSAQLNGPWSRTHIPQPRQEVGRSTLPDDAGMGPDSARKKFPPRAGVAS